MSAISFDTLKFARRLIDWMLVVIIASTTVPALHTLLTD